jgi:hypothetical protein
LIASCCARGVHCDPRVPPFLAARIERSSSGAMVVAALETVDTCAGERGDAAVARTVDGSNVAGGAGMG